MTSREKPKVSVVIATYRREEVLCETVRGVLAQEYPDFEVIVVDQTERHQRETEEYLEKVKDRVQVVKLERASVTAAENEGIRRAHGEVVLFLDDDVRVEAGLIAAHAANYGDQRWTGVAGLVLDSSRGPARRLPEIVTGSDAGWFFFPHNYNRRVEVRIAQGANMSFRREALLGVGGVDEGLIENAIHWEIDLCSRIVAQGGRIVHDPLAKVFHLRYATGGCRMGRTKPRSYFDNFLRVVFRHVSLHQRLVILWRLLRDYVVMDSRMDPVALGRMCWRMGCSLAKIVCRGEPGPILMSDVYPDRHYSYGGR